VIRARAIGLGNWFPVAFPNSTITPKMHHIIYHMPDIAEAPGSAGQSSEQVIESFHASYNLYARNFVCIQNDCERFASLAQNQWHRSWQGQGSVRNFFVNVGSRKQVGKGASRSKAQTTIRALRGHRRTMRVHAISNRVNNTK
jgi:hypothetical protein